MRRPEETGAGVIALPVARPPRLDLEQNLALMAGAGAGKTYSLVTICLHLLGGARSDGVALRPAELCLLTFTDKAAGELRTRLRERLDALASADARDDSEPELRASFEKHERPFPDPEAWRRLRDELGAAAIGTFHSLCVQLLRRAPAGFGIDPAFDLLDEADAGALISDCSERVVLEALQREEPEVVELCREVTFSGSTRQAGVVDFLVFVLQKIREEGLPATAVRIGELARERREFENLLREARAGVSAGMAEATPEVLPHLAHCGRVLEALDYDHFEEVWPRLRQAAGAYEWPNGRSRLGKALKPFTDRCAGATPELAAAYASCRIIPHEAAFRGLLGALEQRLDEEFRRRGVLDFSALLIRTRDLLRDHVEVRREVQERFRALLVDEFQDTNRLQLELVTLIAERREGAPRAVATTADAVLELPLEPRFLCAVGDRKQSIYEFRGADVSVFEDLARKIEAEGGARGHLQTNRRSTPRLLAFFNALFAQVMAAAPDAPDFEVAYSAAGDDLRPHRKNPNGPWGVERILLPEPPENAEQAREADAKAVARRIRGMLASGAEIEHRDRTVGPVRGGDVAILLRRFTHLEAYRQELIREGVPHRVVRGRGFYGAQEVMDLASLLSLVADGDDAISFAAVLRSPLVALSDASLLKIALDAGGRLTLRRYLDRAARRTWALPDDEQARLDRFLALHAKLAEEKGRLRARTLLEVALEETSYRISLAATPYAEQALANVEKLLELADRWDAAPSGDLARFAREILDLADAEPREAQADVLDEGDPRAVQILTVHQAKGLEWPVVFVPELGAGRKPNNERLLYDRREGLGIKGWIASEAEVGRGPRLVRISGQLSLRELAESKRLLYVAATRARDHLVLSGQAARGGGNTWWQLVGRAIEDSPAVRALITDLAPADALPRGQTTLELVARDLVADARAEKAVARVRHPVAPAPRNVVFPVTHLQDYGRCARRYQYAHVVGLAEAPPVLDVEEPSTEASGPDPRERGTMAHRLLERVDLSVVGTERQRAHLEELLWTEGVDPSLEPWAEVVVWVDRFLRTPFAARLASAGVARVHRELPFVLRLPTSDRGLVVHLKGQIDLLFEDEDGGATVIDYKASTRHPEGLAPYAFQLDCYALAALAFVQEGVRVRTGIAYLREENPGPDVRDAPGVDSAAIQARLVSLAERLTQDTRTHAWQGVDRARCEALRCGYRYRCHPDRRGL